MNTLAIVHYHLDQGGVTRVIQNHLLALQSIGYKVGRIVLIHGGRSNGGFESEAADTFSEFDLSQCTVPLLDYDTRWAGPSRGDRASLDLASDIAAAALSPGESSDQVVLHVHNHALGKNYALPGAVRLLAERGFRCLLQIHDFAEDLRPDLYRHLLSKLDRSEGSNLATILYPQAPQIHYAALNGRDLKVLTRAGTAKDRLHYLPNPVTEPRDVSDRRAARRRLDPKLPDDRRLVVYPVRGIRRKNVGELLLWAAMFGDSSSFVLSLAPTSPVERTAYERFERLSRALDLPVYFDSGGSGGLSWSETVAASDVMITTSVAEGFGMVYLESWLTDRGLIGRDLPEITCDFRDAGLRLNGLSPQLRIPVDWCGRDSILDPLRAADQCLREAYGLTPRDAGEVEREWVALVEESDIDFARLSPTLQSSVVRRVSRNPSASLSSLVALNPDLASVDRIGSGEWRERIDANATVVKESFGLRPIGHRLAEVYGRVMQSDVSTTLSALPGAEDVLKSFMDVRRIYPIRFA